jgi:RNA-binding protein YlmH
MPGRGVWSGIFREAVGDILLEDGVLRLIVVNEERKEIERWIPSTSGAR